MLADPPIDTYTAPKRLETAKSLFTLKNYPRLKESLLGKRRAFRVPNQTSVLVIVRIFQWLSSLYPPFQQQKFKN
ncbi:hypothetical protein DSOL_5373 [Desulfosporosinus metallidurans]|uniref:Uncharacterized protein n=1 Tax=Desulfosporosinus metallidurans TaxID=1888891 RepID=A0A1Q8QCM7_9FIRM|nr:hypothetical protein DSOL_5373 [Desulfosporosinus metallidurans]